MPEMHFRVRWPDGSTSRCYSPSLVIKEFLVPGTAYPLEDFVERSRTALAIASARVQARFGYPCGHARRQTEEIEGCAARFRGDADAAVLVESFED